MPIDIPKEILADPSKALELEWIDTNGLGGWASSSVLGCNTRSYHGTLVSAVLPPTDRQVLLSRLDESLKLNSERIDLSTRDFQSSLHPKGYQYLNRFSQSIFSTWEYKVGNICIKKSLCCIQQLNAVAIRYEVEGDEIEIFLEPFLAARSYHALQHWDSSFDLGFERSNKKVRFHPSKSAPAIEIRANWQNYLHNPTWHHQFFYREESKRGLASKEDLINMGTLSAHISIKNPLTILITSDQTSEEPDVLFNKEIQSREALSLSLKEVKDPSLLEFHKQLSIAAEQFFANRGTGKTILAGYHWFTDWGRDTLIAMRGLCIAPKKLELAQQILEVFSHSVRNGLVPNRFLEDGKAAEYNTVDASLWMFIAAYDFYQAGGSKDFIAKVLLPTLISIFKAYSKGTSFEIYEDKDGLISSGNPSTQLTWMDAKIGDWVVTPRHGKAVEINALWYNALCILNKLATDFSDPDLAKLSKSKSYLTLESFTKTFWNSETNCLFDVVRQDFKDPSIRPNQIFAIGLPFCLLEPDKARSVFQVVSEELLTPRGLRTLACKDKAYKGKYEGAPLERDSAYHQGTVWPWLLGAYVDALFLVGGENASSVAKSLLKDLSEHINEAGLGSYSEVFDGDFPHLPRGTIAQAWSVGEILRVLIKHF